MYKRIAVVTGCAGFIGTTFTRLLLEKGWLVYGIDKFTYVANFEEVQWLADTYPDTFTYTVEDIKDIDRLPECDVVFNLAAESDVDNSILNMNNFIDSNISGVKNLLEIITHRSVQIKNNKPLFFQISTDEVYGTLTEDDLAFTENSPLKPNSPYAASKTAADLLCRSFYETYQYPISITRCSNNYGPNQHNEKLIPKLIENIREGNKVPIYGDGKNIRDWVHVQDHCEAIDVVLHKGKDGEVYNIGGECEKRNIEIVDDLLLSFEQGYDLVEYVEDRKGHDWRYAMNISKIKQKLDWSPRITFREGMKELINK